jgi:hypothetical protein
LRGRNTWTWILALVIIVAIVAIALAGTRSRSQTGAGNSNSAAGSTGARTGDTPDSGAEADNPGGGDTGGQPAPANAQQDKRSATDLPLAAAKPPPAEQPFHGCPPTGDGGDPVLNTLKNRTDTAGWNPIQFDALEKLAWPQRAERSRYDSWPKDVRAQIDKFNGIPVSVEGYLFNAQQQGPESNNCHAIAPDTDYHIWLTAAPGQDRTGSVVVEVTPRVRAGHPAWTVAALRAIAHNNERVRISGWTMFDPEHPDQVTKTRGTIWEVHPVMKIEVMRNGQWQDMDNLR